MVFVHCWSELEMNHRRHSKLQVTVSLELTDAERETLIQECQSRLQNIELSSDAKREIWQRMRELINGRSPEQVRSMEKGKGLELKSG